MITVNVIEAADDVHNLSFVSAAWSWTYHLDEISWFEACRVIG